MTEILAQADLTVTELQRSKRAVTAAIPRSDRRRTRRARIQIPLFVYGYTRKSTPFLEKAHTVEINAHGALIVMKMVEIADERLLLTNEASERTQGCTVRSVTVGQGQEMEVAVVFATPAPLFWRKLGQQLSQKCS